MSPKPETPKTHAEHVLCNGPEQLITKIDLFLLLSVFNIL